MVFCLTQCDAATLIWASSRDSQSMIGRRGIARSAEITRAFAWQLLLSFQTGNVADTCHPLVLGASHNAECNCDHTIIDWYNLLRELCERYLEEHPTEVGDFDENDNPITVEIDESKFFHRKYHRGQWRPGHWVFGGVEQVSKMLRRKTKLHTNPV